MIPCLVLGLLSALQEDPLAPPSRQVRVYAKTDLWFGSFKGGGGLSEWFGREAEGKDAPHLSYHREGRVGDRDLLPGVEVQVRWGEDEHKYRGIRAMFRYGSWSESGTVGVPFTVDGTTVPAGSPFQSLFLRGEASVGMIGGIRPADLPVEAWGWVGCHLHTQRFKMKTTSGTLRDGAGGLNFDLGGHAEIRPLPFLFAAGELSGGIGFGAPEVQAMISGGLAWKAVRIEAGYRHLWTVDLDGGNEGFHLSLGGPFVGASIRF